MKTRDRGWGHAPPLGLEMHPKQAVSTSMMQSRRRCGDKRWGPEEADAETAGTATP